MQKKGKSTIIEEKNSNSVYYFSSDRILQNKYTLLSISCVRENREQRRKQSSQCHCRCDAVLIIDYTFVVCRR